MKRFLCISMTLVLAVFFFGGCSVMEKVPMPKMMESSSKKSADPELYRKVPASMRAEVKEAEYDLKRAQSNINLSEKKLQLSELKKEREILRNKYAKFNRQLADVLEKKANMRVEIKKMEAIDNSNLGDKEANIKRIASLKTKQLGIETDIVGIKADMDTTKVQIRKLTKQIIAQEKKIKYKKKKK